MGLTAKPGLHARHGRVPFVQRHALHKVVRRLARTLGLPRAPRTVGSAIAANTIGYLIPCHRVIRAGGEVGDYRWGSERKLALLGHEAARQGD